jgi:tetratricopeptide (TPR) repeat protein
VSASRHRTRSSAKRRRIERPVRLAAILFFVLALGTLVVTTSLGSILRSARPGAAVAAAPWDARAGAALADRKLQDSRGKAFEDAARIAATALERDPTVGAAWRVLGIATALRGDEKRSLALFRATQKINRRDLATQLWFIEERVGADDIEGALRHYDTALRTEPDAAGILLPVLARASAEPAVAGPLLAMLARQPAWLDDFLGQLAAPGLSERAVVGLLSGLERQRGFKSHDRYRMIATTMINRGQASAGRQILMLLSTPVPTLLRNGDFSGRNINPPLDWALAEQTGVTSQQIPIDQAGGPALVMRGSGGDGGDAARQLIKLPAGTYALTARYGAVEGSTPASTYVAVRCATLNAPTLAETTLPPPGPRAGLARLTVRIPSSCTTQWVLMGIRPSFGPGEIAAWIDNAAITPVQ